MKHNDLPESVSISVPDFGPAYVKASLCTPSYVLKKRKRFGLNLEALSLAHTSSDD